MQENRSGAETAMKSETAPCVECGKPFPKSELLQFGQYYVCADDKSVFQQKLSEGAFRPQNMRYAGFWRRTGAVFIDGIIISVGMVALTLAALAGGTGGGWAQAAASGLPSLISLFLGVGYYVFFQGKFGATPGKMALGIKVVRANGAEIGYALALGRYFAYLLSSFTLMIGYLMAAFDKEKRSLHDRICGTRVIHT